MLFFDFSFSRKTTSRLMMISRVLGLSRRYALRSWLYPTILQLIGFDANLLHFSFGLCTIAGHPKTLKNFIDGRRPFLSVHFFQALHFSLRHGTLLIRKHAENMQYLLLQPKTGDLIHCRSAYNELVRWLCDSLFPQPLLFCSPNFVVQIVFVLHVVAAAGIHIEMQSFVIMFALFFTFAS